MTRVNLNYDWKFKPDFKEEYIDNDFPDFERVNIPHTNKLLDYNNFDESLYQFVSCYKKTINIPSEYTGKVLLLKFEGIGSYARLYINGKFVSEHFGGYTPFETDISDVAVFGANNELVVECDSREREDIPPFGNVIDYLTYGGIYREVWLEVKEPLYIRDVFIKTFNVTSDAKTVDIDVQFSQKPENGSLLFEIMDKNNDIISIFSSDELQQKFHIVGNISGATVWDIDNPALYTLNVQLIREGTVIDEMTQKFGFREVKFKPDGFYLNNRKIKLRGLNRHQSYPYVGYAMPQSAQKKDADILKFELGVNIVRTSHYPQSRHFLDRCDEIGLLVLEEIPGWQHIGQGKWRDIVLENVEDMIKRDRNHPSIILWGVRINESPDCDELYKKTNDLAHSLDMTRQTGGVRNFKESHLFEDVYTYNDFIHTGTNTGLDQPAKVNPTNAPYLVTEHNGHMYPTKRFDHEGKRLEHALRHLRVMNKMMGDQRISGSIGWCAFDYNTHKDFGSGDRICYHGVGDMFRIPKLAWYAYASQQKEAPVMVVSSSMDIGEHPAGELGPVYAFTNCDYIKLYKNDEYIKTFYPDKTHFGNLDFAPIIIDDFIGELLEKNESISKQDSEKVKLALKDAAKYGLNLPLKSKLTMGRMMLKYKLSLDDCTKLFGKYVSNWGGQKTSFKFEGYKNDKLVKTVIKSAATQTFLQVIPDETTLIEHNTYDVTRVVLKAVDEHGNLLPYASDAVNLELEGDIEIIGPKYISLIGGAIAFWVKTKGKSCNAAVTVKSEKYGDQKLEFKVQA